MLAVATIVFDARMVEAVRWAVGLALLLAVCVAMYTTWPEWSWEKR